MINLFGMKEEEIRELYKEYPYPNVYGRAVLRHPYTPEDILLDNIHISEMYINTNLPIEVYEKGLALKDESITGMIARASYAPPLIFYKIYKDYRNNKEIMYDLASNNRCPISILCKLARDKNWDVVSRAVSNKNATIECIKFAIKHEDPRVLISVNKVLKLRFDTSLHWRDVASFDFEHLHRLENKEALDV
jgi:hypothetical protein